MRLEVRRHCGSDGGDYWLFLCCGGGGDQSSLNLMMKSLISISLWKWFAHSHRLRSWRIVAANFFCCRLCGVGERGQAACVAGNSRVGWPWQLYKGKGEGEFKDGFVFSCRLILLLFFGFYFSKQVDWFLIKIKSIVGWASLARFLFQLFKFGGQVIIH